VIVFEDWARATVNGKNDNSAIAQANALIVDICMIEASFTIVAY
jgi:hypothetical protein